MNINNKMGSKFYIGQEVVCIYKFKGVWADGTPSFITLPILYNIYTIEGFKNNELLILKELQEFNFRSKRIGYDDKKFASLDKLNKRNIEELLKQIPEIHYIE